MTARTGIKFERFFEGSITAYFRAVPSESHAEELCYNSAMKSAAALVTFLSFFMWIQPLGAFIAPGQESTVCGGQRAFHMCSTQFISTPADYRIQTTSITSAAGSQNPPSTPGASGSDLELTSFRAMSPDPVTFFRDTDMALPAQIFFLRLDAVPKR